MATDQPAKRVKLTGAPVTGVTIKEEPIDGTTADPDLEIVFVKDEIVVKPPVTWQHRIAITEAEKAEKEKNLGEIERAREVEERRIAEVTARTKETKKREKAVRAEITRQKELVSKLQMVFGAENVLGRLGDLFSYSDAKYRGAVDRFCKLRSWEIVVTTAEIEASCRRYMDAERYAEESFRIISLNIGQPRDMRSLASETVKLTDDIFKVVHEDAATREVLWKLIRRFTSGIVFCESDQEAVDLCASSMYPDLWATITWAGVWRNGEHRLGEAEKMPPASAIAIEEAKVEKLVDEKVHLEKDLAELKEKSDKISLEIKDAEKEVDRLDYMIVVKKDYCAANASSDVPLE